MARGTKRVRHGVGVQLRRRLGERPGKRDGRERQGRGEDPDGVVARGAAQQRADGRPERQTGPDRDAEAAEGKALTAAARRIDGPGCRRRVERALAGAGDKPAEDQLRDVARDQIEQAADTHQRGPHDEHDPPPAPVGEAAGEGTRHDRRRGIATDDDACREVA